MEETCSHHIISFSDARLNFIHMSQVRYSLLTVEQCNSMCCFPSSLKFPCFENIPSATVVQQWLSFASSQSQGGPK